VPDRPPCRLGSDSSAFAGEGDEALPGGLGDELGAAAGAEEAHDLRDAVLDRVQAEEHRVGDLLVRPAARDQLDDLEIDPVEAERCFKRRLR
jgi:hypothetical protein